MDSETRALARQQANLYKVFSSTQRVLIIWVLDECECTVSGIAEAIDASLQNTSQHLNLMKDKGILTSRREGREIYYRIVEDETIQNCQVVKNHPSIFS
ncbi:MAG: ArsR family transcriptional regulator [Chloroflexota bacterium]|nr:MAG: ArsR family transcriptional regulator [Chloroflexota bacterium]